MILVPEHALVVAAIVAFLTGAVKARSCRPDAGVPEATTPVALQAGLGLMLGALVLRAYRTGEFPVYGGFEVLSWYGIALTAGYMHLTRRARLDGIGTLLFPVLAVIAALSGLLLARPTRVPEETRSIWLSLHIVTALTGYGLFTLESLLGGAYLIQDYNLKRKRFGPLFKRLPPLETLDRLMAELISASFLLFSVAIGLGVYLAHSYDWPRAWPLDPKVIATAGTWCVYAVLFHLRRSAGRHGRKMALVAVVGFAMVLVAALGIPLFTESMHSFLSSVPGGNAP